MSRQVAADATPIENVDQLLAIFRAGDVGDNRLDRSAGFLCLGFQLAQQAGGPCGGQDLAAALRRCQRHGSTDALRRPGDQDARPLNLATLTHG